MRERSNMFKYQVLDEQLFSLRFGGNNPHLIPRYGLIYHGPIKRLEHSQLQLRFVYPNICVSHSIGKLKRILVEGSDKFPGFKRVYRSDLELLEDVVIEREEISNPQKSIRLKKALEEDCELSVKPVYIVVVPPYPRWFRKSPYYLLKAYLLKYGIMSQMVRTDTITTRSLEEVAFNMANAIFAKASGEPWRLFSKVISFSGTSEKVAIIGMGISRIPKEPGYKEYDRYAGFTILYSDEGQLLYIRTFVTEYDRQVVFRELKRAVVEAVDKFSGYGEIDVIIHYAGKELGGPEEEKLVRTIEELEKARKLKVHYSVLRIVKNPLYRVFSTSKHGYPPMGLYVRLGERLILTYTIGYLRNMSPMGVPVPLLLSIRLSNISIKEINIEALVSSVCKLARLNWRGTSVFNREPVTIKYSRLLAYLSASLKEAGGLNPEDLPAEKPWFL